MVSVWGESTTDPLSNNQTDYTSALGAITPTVMRNDYSSQIFVDPPRGQTNSEYFKQTIVEIYKNHTKTIIVIANVLIVLLVTICFTKLFASNCQTAVDKAQISDGVKAYCESYFPLDRVVVDIDLNTTSHCYSSKSCVVLAEGLKKQQGKFRYNFIIGAYGFVYIEHGYKCQTEERENALYLRLPADSIYNGEDFMAAHKAISKFNEILREGLECGKILHNYTITATGCGRFDDWCTRVLQELVAEESPDRGITGPRKKYFDDTQEFTDFNPLNLKRVYNYQYKLIVCNATYK